MRSKRYRKANEIIEKRMYSINEAVEKVKETATAKFDEALDIVIILGVDPKKSDQMVRGNVVLPHGTGKKIKVAVAAEGEDIKTALDSGAELSGKDEVIKAINNGNIDFDILIATPACMKDLGKYGKILGPKNLMPSPKSGTVVNDIAEAVKRVKQGQIEFKMNKNGIIYGILGKISFSSEKLIDNFNKYLDTVRRSRPASTKGKFITKVFIASTMGPSVSISV